MFSKLSDIQLKLFKSISGKSFQKDFKGQFPTDRPYDKEWDMSPWLFSYVFQKDTGYLFCELTHRMTNNRTYGWDYEGKELPYETIKEIFPSDDFMIIN